VYLYVGGPEKINTVLDYVYQMGAAIFRKLFMSSASSALGTGAAIGISNAVAPAAPSIQGSNITSADVDDSKNLMKFDFYGGTSPYPLWYVDRRGTRANIEIHSFIKINLLIIYFHSKNSKRIGINE